MEIKALSVSDGIPVRIQALSVSDGIPVRIQALSVSDGILCMANPPFAPACPAVVG
jgi:hypothetical protein